MTIGSSGPVFAKIAREGRIEGITGNVDRHSRDWYRERARDVLRIQPQDVLDTTNTLRQNVAIGNMYLFHYDPKLKETLPYWDMFPLIFPFDYAKGGFYGINLHYRPHMLRAVLMDRLYTLSKQPITEASRLELSYKTLKQASKFRYFEPCVKHYLYNHVRSRFMKINAPDWDIALFLPLERFQKASRSAVFAESRMKLKV